MTGTRYSKKKHFGSFKRMNTEKKKRGRPPGTRNSVSHRRPMPDLQSSFESVNMPKLDDTARPTQMFKGHGMLKVKRHTTKSDDRLTMLQIHERRIGHIQSINDIDSSDVDYLISAMKHIKRRSNDDNSCIKGAMLNEYVQDCFSHTSYSGNNDSIAALHTKVIDMLQSEDTPMHEDVCDCNAGYVIDTSTATRICTSCGTSTFYQDCNTHDLWSEERVQVLSKIAYKRINHFREWCNSIQARQQPNDALLAVIAHVRLEIKKERIHDLSVITPAKIRAYLHTLRLGKYYEFTSAIYAEITGKPIPRFSACTEHTLMQMFTAIQPVFDQMTTKKRKNFLSYSYTLNKLAQIIQENDILEFFPLLKSREKLYAQDQLWKSICEQMNWPFHPSI